MKHRLLTIFRAFALTRLSIALLFLLLPTDRLMNLHLTTPFTLVEVTLLLVYLSLPGLRRTLGQLYLPGALVWATLVPLLAQNVTLYLQFEALASNVINTTELVVLQNTLTLSSVNQTILVLIVPLIIVAWTYSRSVLAVYCGAIALLDVLASLLFFSISPTLFLIAFALIIFRTVLYGIIGIMINQIVSIQLEQQQYLVRANEQLREYAAMREQLATSSERNRIARELHDTLAHTLSAATVQLEAVSLIWQTQPDKAQQLVTKSATMMRDGLAETRRALQALRAGSLDNESLVAAITRLAQSLMTRYPILIDVRANESVMLEEPATEYALYRIIQEAVFNAARHAQAKRISIEMIALSNQVMICVTDDGIGFGLVAASTDGHYGLRGMKERARQMGADLQIHSEQGSGTTVTITVARGTAHDTHIDL
jgi:signal transduction histidine kinase